MPRLGALVALLGPAVAGSISDSSSILRQLESSSYEHLGCYADLGWEGGGGRALDVAFSSPEWMDLEPSSLDLVVVFNIPAALLPPSKRDAGGSSSFDLYRIGNGEAAAVAGDSELTPSPASNVPPNEYMGCYVNHMDKALEEGYSSARMSPESCSVYCIEGGYDAMGLLQGSKCWCGFVADEPLHSQRGEGTCDAPCTSNASSDMCGGYWSFSVYAIGEDGVAAVAKDAEPTPSPTSNTTINEYIGCFADDGFDRVLEPAFKGKRLTPEGCNEHCANKGYTYMSVQSGDECWCEDFEDEEEYAQNGKGKCNMTCAGDASQQCDGVCEPNPCRNGGSCEVDIAGLYTCLCPSGYSGVTCNVDTLLMSEFSIEVDFRGTWSPSREKAILDAAYRWEQVLTHIPCTGTNANGGPAGELRINATLSSIDEEFGFAGSSAPTGIWENCSGISYAGDMTFDIADIPILEEFNVLDGVVTNLMGAVIGVGTLWGECSDCLDRGSPEWLCPLGQEVYNNLAGNPVGTPADIIELDDEAGVRCSFWSEEIFQHEVMTGFVDLGGMPLSKLTAATLADRGYAVNMAMTDDYILPSREDMTASALVARQSASALMSETDDESGEAYRRSFYINAHTESGPINVSNGDGDIVGTIEGRRLLF
eukprot:g6497.t1